MKFNTWPLRHLGSVCYSHDSLPDFCQKASSLWRKEHVYIVVAFLGEKCSFKLFSHFK